MNNHVQGAEVAQLYARELGSQESAELEVLRILILKIN